MNPLMLLNPGRGVMDGALIFSVVLGIYALDKSRQAKGYEKAQAEYVELALKASETARLKEQELQAKTALITKAKDDKIAAINSRLAIALSELRNRPERPSAGGVDPGNCKGATGAELYRNDAEFLSREAARADTIRAALGACYEQYDSLLTVK